MKVSASLFFCLFLFLQSSHSQVPKWQEKIEARARFVSGGLYYVPVQDVAECLNVHTYYSSKVRKAVLYVGSERITVSAFNPFVIVGNEILQMPAEAKYASGDILVPVKFFLPILRRVLSAEASGSANSSNGPGASIDDISLTPSADFNIVGVSVEEKANGTLIRVGTTRHFADSNVGTRYSRRWLYLDILDGKLNERALPTRVASGLVKKIVPVQQNRLAQISFQLSKDISSKEILVSQSSDEILISIPTKDQLSEDLIAKLKTDRNKWKIDVVVIDPGHGGKDPGAIGPSGVYEKDVVLGVAKKLKTLLEKKLNIAVYMTRDSDKFLSLKERTQFANRKQGKLFISIHANWNPNRKVRGASTYFLGLAKSDEALEIAQRENAVISYEDNHRDYAEYNDERIILATMAQNAYNKESQDFAAMIQSGLRNNTGLVDRGVKQAGFYVLVGASMPNVLIETAFISNKTEEKLLSKSSFQQKMAEGIYESVVAFKKKYEQLLFVGE